MRPIVIILSVWFALLLEPSLGIADPTVINQTVGPTPNGVSRPVKGGLIVYSKTERNPDQEETGAGDIVYYYPHSSYAILTETGQLLKYVRNHIGDHDEEPQQVDLPIGRYKIKALSEKDGVLVIPIVIKSGRTTILNLEQKDNGSSTASNGAESVKSPSGQAIGWKAQ